MGYLDNEAHEMVTYNGDEPVFSADTEGFGSEENDSRTGSILSSVFNLANTILGSGILTMPFVVANTGIVLFVIILALVAVVADYAISLMVRTAQLKGLPGPSYPELGQAALGNRGYYLVIGSIILQQLGACTGYINIISDVISPKQMFASTGNDVIMSPIFWKLMIVACVIIPLCMLRNIDNFKYTSLASLALFLAFVCLMLAWGSQVDTGRQERHLQAFKITDTFVRVIPLVSFAFICHFNVGPIYKELKDASPQRFSIVSKSSMVVALIIYFLSGCFGYMIFLDCTESDVLRDFRITGTHISKAVDVLRVGVGIGLIFSYPIILWELRHCVDILLFKGKPYTLKRHIFLNLGIISLCTLVAILVSNIGVVFGFVGATSGSLILFIMPPLFYIYSEEGPLLSSKKLPALVMLSVGIILIPLCITGLVISQVTPVKIPDTCSACRSHAGRFEAECLLSK